MQQKCSQAMLGLALAVHGAQTINLADHRFTTLYRKLPSLDVHTAPGLEYAIIPRGIISDFDRLQDQAEILGLTFEIELIKIVGKVPMHFHQHSSGVITRITGPEKGVGIALYGVFGFMSLPEAQATPMFMRSGSLAVIPAGMHHGLYLAGQMRENEAAYLVSINTPPLAEDDTIYV